MSPTIIDDITYWFSNWKFQD